MVKNSLSVILETNKLTGPNYSDWLRNLKIVLDFDKRTYVLNQSPPNTIPDDATEDMWETVNRWREEDLQTRCLMLASMSSELQKSHEHMKHACEIHMHLEELYLVQTHYEWFNTSKESFRARMVEGSSVHKHGLKMISLIEKLEKLDFVMDNDLYIDLIRQSLSNSFDQFVVDFNTSKLEVTINELVNMLVTAKFTMKKDKMV